MGLINFWPRGTAEWTTFAVALTLAVVLGVLLFHTIGRPVWPRRDSLDYLSWERDRVLAVAKGTASSAVGFLTAVVVALLRQDIKSDVPEIAVLGCLLGAVGLLLFAAQMSLSVRVTKAMAGGA
jgi:hypothetical protein